MIPKVFFIIDIDDDSAPDKVAFFSGTCFYSADFFIRLLILKRNE